MLRQARLREMGIGGSMVARLLSTYLVSPLKYYQLLQRTHLHLLTFSSDQNSTNECPFGVPFSGCLHSKTSRSSGGWGTLTFAFEFPIGYMKMIYRRTPTKFGSGSVYEK